VFLTNLVDPEDIERIQSVLCMDSGGRVNRRWTRRWPQLKTSVSHLRLSQLLWPALTNIFMQAF
jgi:hypothetical protein